jgi:capsular polysaccharide transport system permease protein
VIGRVGREVFASLGIGSGAGLQAYRNSLGIALSVWKALLLREALSRLFSSRAAWFWLIAEPVLHMAILGFLYAVVRQHTVGGIDATIWLVLGLQGFFLFRRTATQMSGAIDSNRALFSYRQVKPTDTVLMRGVLEGVLMVMVISVIVAGLALLGHDVVPIDPITVLSAFFGLWVLGAGIGLIVSVVSELVPEFRQIISMTMMPLYFISGVIVPIGSVPEPYRDWLLMNPIVHGLDAARKGFAPYYHSTSAISLNYLYACALVSVFLGLVLHRRYTAFMVTK